MLMAAQVRFEIRINDREACSVTEAEAASQKLAAFAWLGADAFVRAASRSDASLRVNLLNRG